MKLIKITEIKPLKFLADLEKSYKAHRNIKGQKSDVAKGAALARSSVLKRLRLIIVAVDLFSSLTLSLSLIFN